MCDETHPTATTSPASPPVRSAAPATRAGQARRVAAVHLTTPVDNLSDMRLVDQGPAKRAGVVPAAGAPRVAEPLFEEGGTLDGLPAEHGFSMLVTIERGDQRSHRFSSGGD